MSGIPAAEAVLARRAAMRLGLQAALLGSAIVVLLCAAAVFVVLGSQQSAATALLDAAVSRADDVGDPPAGVWLVMPGPGGQAATPGLPAGLPDSGALARAAAGGPPESADRRIGGVEYRIETLRQPDGRSVQGVLDLSANHAERDRLIATMLACGLAGLLLAALAGTWLGHRALRPMSAALALQRRFVADAGHELRTPVTLLNTRAQLARRRLGKGADPATAQATVAGIIADSARLGDILEDLLLVADPLAERPREPVDLVAVVAEVLAAAGPAAAQQDVALRGPQSAEPVRVPGSPVALRRALTALVDNAVRHARAEVVVTLTVRDRNVLIDVVDDGPGIDPDVLPRLFERFVSAASPAPDRQRRYGLGLALVSEIAAAHGGGIEVLDRPGPGSTLRIALRTADGRGRPRIL